MRMPVASRIIYTQPTAIFIALTSHLAAYNDGHLFNPDWQPHAKFRHGVALWPPPALNKPR